MQRRRALRDDNDWRHLSKERFGLLLFLAAAFHGVLLLMLSFDFPDPPPPPQTLDITLAQYEQAEAPEDADFIAQSNQQGSGSSEEKEVPSSPDEANFTSETPRPQSAQAAPTPPSPDPEPVKPTPPTPEPPAQQPQPQAQSGERQVVTTEAKAQPKAAESQEQTAASKPQPTRGTSTSLLARSLEIASLQAQIENERQAYAKRPRVLRLTAASTLSHDDAQYLDNWRRKIESVGNLNYPEKARRDKIYGVLRVLVEIQPDGSVDRIQILESSGHAILDDAAVRIVQLAAPFQPFPVEMRKRADKLAVIRTWKFEKQARVY
ncbi:energy transducer TonB [Marinobacterium lutimaris]|uniref:Protein TonB n=1 Tax=Marinobacterium lutimaris TaxID=568106 RepID=A0A1H6DAM1_9GAMM|nr:energy transducer TonB [Marinobacterium lutimaris]SEG82278.1 protein TonB [Marinobacterium lutimaris]